MDSPTGVGVLVALCVSIVMALTAPLWIALGVIVFAVLRVMF